MLLLKTSRESEQFLQTSGPYYYPILQLIPFTVPTPADRGSFITLQGIISNQGTRNYINRPYYKVYLSEDETFDSTTDVLIAVQEATLDNNIPKVYNFNQEILISIETQAESYSLIFVVNPDNTEQETNENNNITFNPIEIKTPVDASGIPFKDEQIRTRLIGDRKFPDLVVTTNYGQSGIIIDGNGTTPVSWTVTNQRYEGSKLFSTSMTYNKSYNKVKVTIHAS